MYRIQVKSWLALSVLSVTGCVAVFEEHPEFGDVGPCAGLALEEAPACYPDKVVFVAAGAQGGTGTSTQPFGALAEGLLAAAARGADAVAIAGDHELTGSVELVEGVALLGGRFPVTWAQTEGVSRVLVNMPASEDVAVGLIGRDITALTRVVRILVELPDAPASRRAQLGAQLVRAPGVLLEDVELRVGKGARGQDGMGGAAGVDGVRGGNAGADGVRSPGAGGAAAQCPDAAGSSGGTGGTRQGQSATAGTAGQLTVQGLPGGSVTQPGRVGQAGESGAAGEVGAESVLESQGWQPGASGIAGAPGTSGHGGSGGGGGDVVGGDGSGGGGGGGGAGGCGGQGGAPGTSGTDVVGLVVVGEAPELVRVKITAGSGGDGGAGGAGGTGGQGGRGGDFRTGELNGRPGGRGGDGGVGGVGGVGGAGRGGVSLGAVCSTGIALRGSNVVILAGQAGKLGAGDSRARSGESWGCELP
jgi:hypothetical protein